MCAPKIKNKKIRAKILSCFISGLVCSQITTLHSKPANHVSKVLTLVLTIYLALSLSDRNESQEFHVLLILIILITTIFFCHALIRLCMMIIHPPDDSDMRQNLPSMIGPGGYANPSTPIQVALARDEEAVGITSEATKMPPPAYGLWRESVVRCSAGLENNQTLTIYSESIPTAYSGKRMRLQCWSVRTRRGRQGELLPLPIGLLPIYLRMG